MAEEAGNQKEYSKGYAPDYALSYLESQTLTTEEAKAALLDRLIKGAIVAIAHREVGEGWLSEEYTRDYARIPRAAWASRLIPVEFWKTGDVDFPSLSS